MSSNSESIQFGIFSPKDLGISKSVGIDNTALQKQNIANKQEFARIFSQSLDKQVQTQRPVENKISTQTLGKQKSTVAPNRSQSTRQNQSKQIPTKRNTNSQNHVKQKEDSVNPAKPTGNGSHAHSAGGRNLPLRRSNDKADSCDKCESDNTASASTSASKVASRESVAQANRADKDKDKGVNADVNDRSSEAITPENVVSTVDTDTVKSDLTTSLNLAVSDLNGKPPISDITALNQSNFAAVTVDMDVAGDQESITNTQPYTSYSTAQLQTAAIQTQIPGQAEQTPVSPLNGYAQQLQDMGSDSGETENILSAGDAEESDAELLSATALADSSQSEESTRSSSLGRSNDALLRSATEENVIKQAIVSADKAMRSLNEANSSVTNSVSKQANGQPAAELLMGASAGQHGGDSSGSNQQSSQQDNVLFRDRFFALAQQAAANQSQTADSNFNKLILQQSTPFDQAGDDQRVNDVNLNPAREPALANRAPGNPLNMLSPILQMSSAFGEKGWSNEVGQRVAWMLNSDLQQAQLQLNPKHLGPLEIKITMNVDQQINVSFLTHSSAVKDALDQAMPRLREGFDQNGLNLNDVNVQQETYKQNRDQHHSGAQSSSGQSYLAENVHDEIPVAQTRHNPAMSANIVDFYA